MGRQQPLLEHYAQVFDGALDRPVGAEPAWLVESRRRAFGQVRERGLPGRRLESWHYSPLDQWLGERLADGHADFSPPDDTIDSAISADLPGAVFTFSHGRLRAQNAAAEALSGVSLMALAGLDAKRGGALVNALTSRREDALAEMVDALAPEPQLLQIDGIIDQPIVLHHHASTTGSHLMRLIVQVAPGSQATVIEHFSGIDDRDYLTAAHTQIVAGRDSRLTWIRVHRDGDAGQHIGTVDLEQQTGCEVRLQSLAAGDGRRLRSALHVNLSGDDTAFDCRGAFAALGRQHVDHHVTINHLGARGVGRTRFQGIAGDRGRGIMNGRIYIAPHTRANDGELFTHNLLLSDHAEIDAKPELEIYADEVSCVHGATVGQLDAEQLFYLISRGIDRDTAIRMLTEGFLRAGLLELDGVAADYLAGQFSHAIDMLQHEEPRP